jgi:hypothetical protein
MKRLVWFYLRALGLESQTLSSLYKIHEKEVCRVNLTQHTSFMDENF